MSSFRCQQTPEERSNDSRRMRKKYRTKVPIVIEPLPSCTLPRIPKSKFIIEKDVNASTFVQKILAGRPLVEQDSLVLLVDDESAIVPGGQLIGSLDEVYRDADGFLYLKYTNMPAFG